jgi:CRISPR-associated endonuclease Csn1
LRNPVVEKILNQMINVVNTIIDNSKMGRPDEIRIELARELKKSASERAEMSSNINNSQLDAKTDEIDQAKPKQSDHLFCWRRFDVDNYSGSRFFA